MPRKNEREMKQQKLIFLKRVSERKKVDDAEDTFVATIADELRQLPNRVRLLAKNGIKNTLF